MNKIKYSYEFLLHLYHYIPLGEENGLSALQIYDRFDVNYPDADRQTRYIFECMNKSPCFNSEAMTVCGKAGSGYFRPRNLSELGKYYHMAHEQYKSANQKLYHLKKRIKTWGQLEMDLSTPPDQLRHNAI